jgi:hypothetical protein
LTSFDLLSPLQEETHFLLSSNQGCESSCLSNIQSTGDPTCFEYSVHLERLWNTSEGMFPQGLTGKIAFYEAIGGFTDEQGIGLRQPLEA